MRFTFCLRAPAERGLSFLGRTDVGESADMALGVVQLRFGIFTPSVEKLICILPRDLSVADESVQDLAEAPGECNEAVICNLLGVLPLFEIVQILEFLQDYGHRPTFRTCSN